MWSQLAKKQIICHPASKILSCFIFFLLQSYFFHSWFSFFSSPVVVFECLRFLSGAEAAWHLTQRVISGGTKTTIKILLVVETSNGLCENVFITRPSVAKPVLQLSYQLTWNVLKVYTLSGKGGNWNFYKLHLELFWNSNIISEVIVEGLQMCVVSLGWSELTHIAGGCIGNWAFWSGIEGKCIRWRRRDLHSSNQINSLYWMAILL